MENNFVFIIPFRNVKSYIKTCADSIIGQKYAKWSAVFCDDESDDGTTKYIPDNKKFTIRRNEKRITALANIHFGIVNSNLNDDDVICILDGDDFLIRDDVLVILNKLYQDDTLLTYGQYIWPNGRVGHCAPYTEETFKKLRTGGYWASHIRTFKWKLYRELMNQDPDLNCYRDKDGEFYRSCYDVAIMTPLMEIAGFNRIKFNPTPVYYYRVHSQNDVVVDPILQKSIADEVFSKEKFKQVF